MHGPSWKLALTATVILVFAHFFARDAGAKGALTGKVFFALKKPKDSAPKALMRRFAGAKPRAELKQDAEKEWKAVLVAFFRRAPVPGPITIWVYDKADKAAIKAKEAMHIITAQGTKQTVLVYDLVLRPGDGFNKGHVFLLKVGQIIGKRDRIYARGEISLK